MGVGGIVVATHLIIVIGRLRPAIFMIDFHRDCGRRRIQRAAVDGRGSRDIMSSDVFNSRTCPGFGAHGAVVRDGVMIVGAP